VVVILLGLVAVTAPAMAVADDWLDRRLPRAAAAASPAGVVYAVLAVIGLALGSLMVLQAIGGRESQPLGLTVLAAGAVTLVWWAQRLAGRDTPSHGLLLVGRTILVVGTTVGYVSLMPELAGALGIG
jgi:hypothetical protein